jgi:OmpA-OmpF porin, OOP family
MSPRPLRPLRLLRHLRQLPASLAHRVRPAPLLALLLALPLAGAPVRAWAQAAPSPSPSSPSTAPLPVAAPAQPPQIEARTASLPARGLFVGNELSATAKERLTDLIVEALGLQVEVALVVPTGPWQLDGSGADERHLTPARLAAVKRFLQERGVDGRQIYVESRINEQIAEPRLDVQISGRPTSD